MIPNCHRPLLVTDTGQWEKITIPHGTYFVEVNGEDREIQPSCALDFLVPDDPDGVDGQEYSFYFKPGKADKLLVFFNGGGACWDATTCVDSLSNPNPFKVVSHPFMSLAVETWGCFES